MKPSISFFLDASRPREDGTCLIKLNVYYSFPGKQGRKKRYKTDYHCTPGEWKKINGERLKEQSLKTIRDKLDYLKAAAEKIAGSIEPFDFTEFESRFFTKIPDQSEEVLLEDYFNTYIARLKENGQVGTAISYQTTINSLQEFRRGVTLREVTLEYLKEYESWMMRAGKSSTTAGIYLRQLRCIINQAMEGGDILVYPFKDFIIPGSRNVKKALREEEINRLLTFIPVSGRNLIRRKKALDYWLFSYLCNGMNFTDIANLKKEDVDGDFLYFKREKTKRTKKKDVRSIKVPLPRKAQEIIKRRKNTTGSPYLFPILREGMKPKNIKNCIGRFIKRTNQYMDAICTDLGFKTKVTTYTARHTFSTILKRKGVPTSYIKDALGHSSENTTEHYLDSFEDETLLKYADLLVKKD